MLNQWIKPTRPGRRGEDNKSLARMTTKGDKLYLTLYSGFFNVTTLNSGERVIGRITDEGNLQLKYDAAGYKMIPNKNGTCYVKLSTDYATRFISEGEAVYSTRISQTQDIVTIHTDIAVNTKEWMKDD